jgi:hypothetical protein
MGADTAPERGGPAADSVLGPHPRRDQRYILRVWAARALLYARDDSALADESWRVREATAMLTAVRA